MTTSAAKANRNADIVNRLEAEIERLRAIANEAVALLEDSLPRSASRLRSALEQEEDGKA